MKILLDKITHLVILSIDDEHKRRKKMNSIELKTLSDQELRDLISEAKAEFKSRENSQPKQELPRVLRQMYMETLGEDRDSTVTRYN